MTELAATLRYSTIVHHTLTRETWKTWANLVTVIRLVVGIVVFSLAAIGRSESLNFAGLAVYWALDMLDGYLARSLD